MSTPTPAAAHPVRSTTFSIALRTAAVLGLDQAFQLLGPVVFPEDDGLGTGLLFFLALVSLTALWAVVDGVRFGIGRLCVVWVVTGLVAGVVSSALVSVGHGPLDWSVVLSDVRDLTGFLAGLVILPAVLAGGLSAVLTPRRPTHPQQPVHS